MSTPHLNSPIQNAWIFITPSGTTFMIRENDEGCWLSEQAGGEVVTFPSPERAASALGHRNTGMSQWDAFAADVPKNLGEWTQILPTSVFNRRVRDVVSRYETRLKA